MNEIFLGAEHVFSLYGFAVTNTYLLTLAVLLILSAGAFLVGRKMALLPGGGQNAAEATLEGFLGFMEPVFGSRGRAEKYLPFIATIFFFVLFSNWAGILPGVGSVGFFEGTHGTFVPFLRSPASDLNFTLALAITTVIATHVFGIRELGVRLHVSRFLNFKGPIEFFVGILEFISEIAKIISFSFRLFGNVFAGEVLLVVIAFLAPYLAPLPFLFLEIFVGFVQALVFAMLTMVFISIAAAEHH